jgi:superfamily I DNA/RNA helicase
LDGACRLITIQTNGICSLEYAGDHDDCDKWLNANQGKVLNIKNKELVGIQVTSNFKTVSIDTYGAPITEGKLFDKLKSVYLNTIKEITSESVFSILLSFDCFVDEDEILEACLSIEESEIQSLIFDVIISLKNDNVDHAKNRISLYKNEIKTIASATLEAIEEIESGEQYITQDDLKGVDIGRLMSSSSWYDWMLFMHPEQSEVANRDFNGPARLIGVSGSGKTCISINRAIRLAKKYPKEKILITTINLSLARLINNLLKIAIQKESNPSELITQIEVKSFWEVCFELLMEFETDPILKKSFDLYSDKHRENVDSIWREFYLCEENNNDAEVMLPVHLSLLMRNVFPLQYIKQEFDWVRSALAPNRREEYLSIERDGRSESFGEEFRKIILKGITSWEDKMKAVGVSDYLGLVGPLYNYFNKIKPIYRCILVDELQDFGTTELAIIRKLVAQNENDLFLCGDGAQQVQYKHHQIRTAGINIQPTNYLKITKNYRNSREILEAADQILKRNIKDEFYENQGFEILKPEFANFSSNKPFLRKGNNLSSEIKAAYSYLKSILEEKQKACIAICGLTYFRVQNIGNELSLPVLDGYGDIDSENIFLSDLNQTKGFEFDIMIIVNCGQNVFPNPSLPEKEAYREISKLYVAMTRAKRELIISYSGKPSKVFDGCEQFFNLNSIWETDKTNSEFQELDRITEAKVTESIRFEEIIGKNYLYTKHATGLSHPASEKINELINGKREVQDNKPLRWLNMHDFILALRSTKLVPHMHSHLGPKVYAELKERFFNELLNPIQKT